MNIIIGVVLYFVLSLIAGLLMGRFFRYVNRKYDSLEIDDRDW